MSVAPSRRQALRHLVSSLCAMSLLAGLLLTSSASAATRMPAGYPAQVELPKALLGAMLTGTEVAIRPDGTEKLRAYVYEVSRAVRDGDAVQRHFERLFAKLAWRGQFSEGTEGRFARFTNGSVQVDLRIAADAREPKSDRVEFMVRVFANQKPDTRISKR